MKHLAILICATLVGCGGGPSDAPTLAPASGKVLIDGKPVAGLSVAFYPDGSKGTKGPMSVAETSEDGSFRLTTAGSRSGAVIGSHKVVVSCPEFGNVKLNNGGDGVGSSASGKQEATEETEEPKFVGGCPVPVKYTTIENTDLTVDIEAAGATDLLFDLK
ncbi:MAG: hypothetical protein HON04_06600 [Planctomicrobium sp.]|nr:hypothetical protein [Planctomicrobium sp.]